MFHVIRDKSVIGWCAEKVVLSAGYTPKVTMVKEGCRLNVSTDEFIVIGLSDETPDFSFLETVRYIRIQGYGYPILGLVFFREQLNKVPKELLYEAYLAPFRLKNLKTKVNGLIFTNQISNTKIKQIKRYYCGLFEKVESALHSYGKLIDPNKDSFEGLRQKVQRANEIFEEYGIHESEIENSFKGINKQIDEIVNILSSNKLDAFESCRKALCKKIGDLLNLFKSEDLKS